MKFRVAFATALIAGAAFILTFAISQFVPVRSANASPSPAPSQPPNRAPAESPTPPPKAAPIDRNGVLILIRTTLIALQQANQTGNYAVLYGISAPGFQTVNSPERLSQIFANLRAKNFDLSGVVVLEPQLTILPSLYSNGVMRMAGFFPSAPMQVSFDLQYMAVQGQWRLLGIAVDVGSATPPAPMEAPQSPLPKNSESKQSTETRFEKVSPTSSPRP